MKACLRKMACCPFLRHASRSACAFARVNLNRSARLRPIVATDVGRWNKGTPVASNGVAAEVTRRINTYGSHAEHRHRAHSATQVADDGSPQTGNPSRAPQNRDLWRAADFGFAPHLDLATRGRFIWSIIISVVA